MNEMFCLDDSDYSEEDFDNADDREEKFICAFVTGQGCSIAGTDYCQFDCPYKDNLEKHPAYPNCDLLASDFSM